MPCPVALDERWKEYRRPAWLREQIMEYNVLDFSGWRDGYSFNRMYRRLDEGLDLLYRKDSSPTGCAKRPHR